MTGGVVWGYLADRSGRTFTLAVALALNAIFGAASGLTSSFGWFFVCRVLSGVGVGGSIPIVFSYIAEFLPAKRRGSLIVIVAMFWMVGSVFAATMAWAIIGSITCDHSAANATAQCEAQALMPSPRCEQYTLAWGPTSAWRIYVMICSLPAASAAVAMVFAPHSPRLV